MLLHKKRFRVLEFILFSAFIVMAGSNMRIIRSYQSKEIGKGISLSQVFDDADIGGVYRGFNISVQKDDNYFVSSWIQGLSGSVLDILIDGQSSPSGKIFLAKQGWQASQILGTTMNATPVTIHFSSGNHTIIFRGKAPGIPDVEVVRLGKSEDDAFISDTAYQRNLAATKAYAASHALQIKDDTTDVVRMKTGTTMAATAIAQSDPLYDYVGMLNQPFSYTYRGSFYLSQGAAVKFEVKNATTGNMLYLFNSGGPTQTTSWVASGSPINVTIPVTGYYMVMVRAYWTGDRGTGDLYYNNGLWASGITIAGTYYAASLTKSGSLNYFMAKPGSAPYSTDTYMFLSTFRNSEPIMAYNDDYSGSGSFNWGYLSRKQFDFTGWDNPFGRAYIFGSAYSSSYDGTCDYYFCNSNSDIMPYFPNLKADDAVKSANSSGMYNCISWSGGVTSEWIWPPSDSRWNTGGGDLVAFDNYYRNYPTVRYAGAINYSTRVTPSTSGVEIDLWATGTSPNFSYTHGSVFGPGNGEMHGYDWESKPGSLTRTFHPRNALSGSSYGAIVWSYKRAGALGAAMQAQVAVGIDQTANTEFAVTAKAKTLGIIRPLTLDSSIALGLTVRRNVSFTDAEMAKNSALIAAIPGAAKAEFASKYAAWQKTWSDPRIAILSNPREYAKSAEYNTLKAFCLNQGNMVLPLLFQKAQEEPPFIQVLLEDAIQMSALPEMQAVEAEFAGNQFTADGALIYTTNKDKRISLCKKLLKNF